MKFFNPNNRTASEVHQKISAVFTLIYTLIDFSAAVLFVWGSILFFNENTTYQATWMFLIGSIFFGLRPTTTLIRELIYLRLGDYEQVKN